MERTGSSSAALRGVVPHWSLTIEPSSLFGDERRILAANRTTASVKRSSDSSGRITEHRHARHVMSTLVTNGEVDAVVPYLSIPADGRALLIEISDDPAVPLTSNRSGSTTEPDSAELDAVIRIQDRDYPVSVVKPASGKFGDWHWGFVLQDWNPEGVEGAFAARSLSIRGRGWNFGAELQLVPIAPYLEGRAGMIEAISDHWRDLG